MAGATATTEFPGEFDELAEELLRTKTMSWKSVRGAPIKLCQIRGNPFTLEVDVDTAVGPPRGAKPSPSGFLFARFKPKSVQTFILQPAEIALHKLIHAEPAGPADPPSAEGWDVMMAIGSKSSLVPEFQLPRAN